MCSDVNKDPGHKEGPGQGLTVQGPGQLGPGLG